MLQGFRVGQTCTCHFCNTEKGSVTHISGEGVIGGSSNGFVSERTKSKHTFSIPVSMCLIQPYTPEIGTKVSRKTQNLRLEVTNWAFPVWGVM